jgi:catechol 2,3-dioxygenase-like lactoylglutathione lyase family enzyme
MKLIEIAYFTDHVGNMASFYRCLLEREPVAESDGMAIFLIGDTKIFIHKTYSPGAGELRPENHTALAVANVDAVCARLLAEGLALEISPRDYYWGRSAYLRDPDGHLIEITTGSS